MGEPDWRMPMASTSRYGHLQHDVLTRLAVSPCKSLSTNNHHASAGASHRVDFMAPSKESRKTVAGSKKAEKETGELDCTTSGSSSSNSGIDYKRRHRCTLPSITTTTTDSTVSDLSRSGASSGHFADVDYAYLYADGAPEPSDAATTSTLKPPSAFRTSSLATERITTKSHPSVRRVASFTYSPEESTDKHNKRGGSKKFLGPLGKTFNYIKNKVDSAMSTSALYPTKEECRSWQESFGALLNHKYGCYLFRQFLKEEFSDENLDFWL
ncbi:Protein RGS-7 e, partial [Aphelenchoides avenae]